jgi:broad specificity phosphatase PhoE
VLPLAGQLGAPLTRRGVKIAAAIEEKKGAQSQPNRIVYLSDQPSRVVETTAG